MIDTRTGRILRNNETDNDLKGRHPYLSWMNKNVRRLTPYESLPDERVGQREFDDLRLAAYQKQFAYSSEELEQVLRMLGENGQEATGSMGDDTPFAVLSSRPRIIYDYFRQQFAQVTNPPIDPLREAHVMSLATNIGREMNVFCEAEGQAHRLSFTSPVLLYSDFLQLTTMKEEYYRADKVDMTYEPEKAVFRKPFLPCVNRPNRKYVRAPSCWCCLTAISLPGRLPIPAPMAVGALQTGWLTPTCAAMPTLLWKQRAPEILTTLPYCSALAQRQFTPIWPMSLWQAWWKGDR